MLFWKNTYDDHLGGLENEALVGSPGAATRPLPKAATEKANGKNLLSSWERIIPGRFIYERGAKILLNLASRASLNVSSSSCFNAVDDVEKWVVPFFRKDFAWFQAFRMIFIVYCLNFAVVQKSKQSGSMNKYDGI